MSTTTSTNTVTQNVLHLLADYEVHHSGASAEGETVAASNPRQEQLPGNPEWWPTNHQRVPNYRPINRDLDKDMRPAGSFFMETCFILTMLGGVTLNSHAATFWRNTGGRINDKIFRYPIGGEQ